MSEEKKEECCGTSKSGCCGSKKIVIGLILAGLIFTCGYVLGKGHCPFGSCCGQKTCPITKH